MNQGLFRLIFNRRTGMLTPTWEGAPARGKASTAARACVLTISLLCFANPVLANPGGATIINGNVGFNQNGNTLTITNSPNSIINWQSFSINKDEITRFIQQNGASAVLNRVIGQDPSKILGTLQSNGRVFIINPNGIVFGKGATIDVAGLVASTLKMSDADFLNGKYNFSDGAGAGGIKNEGSINTATGGHVYLIAPDIENNGIITSPKGEIVLAAGHSVSLVDPKNPEIVVSLTAPATSAVNVGQLIAEGGGVGIFAGLIKQSGIISANSASVDESGRVYLKGTQSVTVDASSLISVDNSAGKAGDVTVLSDGTTEFNGTITARGATQGGFVETSGKHITIGDAARVVTRAENGNNGTWLIDPTDFIIAAVDGDISGATLSSNLADNNISILSSNGSTTDGNGDIIVNDNVSWSTNNLTLTAARDVQVNAVMDASGDASLTINTATANGADAAVAGGTLRMGFNPDGSFRGRIDYTSTGDLNINGQTYTVINDFSSLSLIGDSLSGAYALGANLTGGTSAPIGGSGNPFIGVFDGLGHTINGLTINTPTQSNVGLFGSVGDFETPGEIRNVGVINALIVGSARTAVLAGDLENGAITNSFVTGSVLSPDDTNFTGGLVGLNFGAIDSSWANVTVSTGSYTFFGEGGPTGQVGGLVGNNSGLITNSYATGSVSGGDFVFAVGGLAGSNTGTIRNSYATGTVYGGEDSNAIGGLVGSSVDSSFFIFSSGGTIENSYATGQVDAGQFAGQIGGLIGFNNGTVMNSYATGAINTLDNAYSVGGLVGENSDYFGVGGVIANSYATGNVTTDFNALDVGGLVGTNAGAYGGMITNSYATGDVRTEYDSGSIGGLVGINQGTISDSYATGTVRHFGGCTSEAANCFGMGGLAGINDGTINNSFATGAVTGLGDSVGGLVGDNGGTISNSYYGMGTVTGGDNAHDIGGLVGYNEGTISNSYATGSVNVGNDAYSISAFVGSNDYGGSISNSYSTGAVTAMNNAYDVGGLVGNFSNSFGGSTISDSYATGTVTGGAGSSYIGGLVGYSEGTIINSYAAGAVNVEINSQFIGGLVGSSEGLISASYATGAVIAGAGSGSVGGLAGEQYFGTIQNSHATGTVSNGDGSSNTGGLVGNNTFGIISNSYATGAVSVGANSFQAGGLVGDNENSGNSISGSYATGAVSAGDNAQFLGGLAGTNSGAISDSFATGSVSSGLGSMNLGGLVGGNAGTIDTSYAIGYVAGAGATTGGLVGVNSGDVNNSYWNTQTSGQLGSAGGMGFTTAQMMMQDTFTGFAFGQVWAIDEGTSFPYQLALFPDGVQVFSGTLDINNIPAVQQTELSSGGSSFGLSSVGANGFHYAFLDAANGIAGGDQFKIDLVNGAQAATYFGDAGAQNPFLDFAIGELTNGSNALNLGNTTINLNVRNKGTINLDGGTVFNGFVTNDNTINANNGTSEFRGGGAFNEVTNVNEGATVNLVSGAYTIDGVEVFRVDGALNNNATVNLSSNIDGTGTISNNATGVINVSGVDTTDSINPLLNNLGTLNVAGSDFYTLELRNSAANNGTINIGDSNNLGLFMDYANNGVIGGKGTINMGQGTTLTNNGSLRPGASPGTLTINGNLVLGAGSVLDIELGGTSQGLFDVLNVNGTASLAGTVHALQFGGFVPNVGDSFTFLNASSVSGTFATVISPVAFRVTAGYGANFTTLTAVLATLPPVDPSVFIDPSGFPNTGSPTGADNNAGTNTNQSTTTFNALLETAPPAAIGGDGLISELYLGEPLTGENRDARLLCQ